MKIIFLALIFLTLASGLLLGAQKALPGESLYPLKIWSEERLIEITPWPEGRLFLWEHWAWRRLEELIILLAKIPQEKIRIVVLRQANDLTRTLEETRAALDSIAKKSVGRALISSFAGDQDWSLSPRFGGIKKSNQSR